IVRAKTVLDHLYNRRPIAHYESLECPFSFENIAQDELVGRSRNAIEIVETGHECEDAGLDACFERGQIHLAQELLGDRGGVVVLARFTGAVAGKVLGARRDSSRLARIRALKAAYHRRSHGGCEYRVLTRALCNASPAWIARDVDHRCERPIDARFRGLARGG